MFYRDEYGNGKCIHCKKCMQPMNDDDLNDIAWEICTDCLFICIPSHFISKESEAHESWHYIYPIFKSTPIIKHIKIKNCFNWFFTENRVSVYTCTCQNTSNCKLDSSIPNKLPFEIQIISK